MSSVYSPYLPKPKEETHAYAKALGNTALFVSEDRKKHLETVIFLLLAYQSTETEI